MNIGATIKKLRTEAGHTQKSFAKLAGIKQAYVSVIENGVNTHTKIETLERMANALKISLASIYVNAITEEDTYRNNPRDPNVIAMIESGKKLILQAL